MRRLGLHKALVCTDKDLIKFGVAQKVLDVLGDSDDWVRGLHIRSVQRDQAEPDSEEREART